MATAGTVTTAGVVGTTVPLLVGRRTTARDGPVTAPGATTGVLIGEPPAHRVTSAHAVMIKDAPGAVGPSPVDAAEMTAMPETIAEVGTIVHVVTIVLLETKDLIGPVGAPTNDPGKAPTDVRRARGATSPTGGTTIANVLAGRIGLVRSVTRTAAVPSPIGIVRLVMMIGGRTGSGIVRGVMMTGGPMAIGIVRGVMMTAVRTVIGIAPDAMMTAVRTVIGIAPVAMMTAGPMAIGIVRVVMMTAGRTVIGIVRGVMMTAIRTVIEIVPVGMMTAVPMGIGIGRVAMTTAVPTAIAIGRGAMTVRRTAIGRDGMIDDRMVTGTGAVVAADAATAATTVICARRVANRIAALECERTRSVKSGRTSRNGWKPMIWLPMFAVTCAD